MQRVRTMRIDGVMGLVIFGGLGLISLISWGVWHQVSWLLAGIGYSVVTGCYLHTTLVGKAHIWERLLTELPVSAPTQALDIGCGHGLVMLKLAAKLPRGSHVTGIDIWRSQDQTNNSLTAVQQQIAAQQLTARATALTADMRDLPFRNHQFDLVVSSLAIHNVKPKTGRLQSLQEIHRVLRPGGQLVIVDLGFSCQEYREALNQLGYHDVRLTGNGLNGWWGGPWMPTLTLRATKS